ncbi:MAG: CBS domain-containing protein [Planctomycetota bacterium]|jgi:CBS domain-containing protein|nr:signal transduction protein [Planctomycetota bacterium]MDP6838803.1 CBS domain-containing protein [Planctomycetota bacterium]
MHRTVRDILIPQDNVTMPPDASAATAAATMTERGVGSILIVNETRELIGIFTERDLMCRVLVDGRDAHTTTLAEVMSTELFTTTPETTLGTLLAAMQERHIRHAPVLEDGAILAQISLRDLLRALLADRTADLTALRSYVSGSEAGI